MITLLTPLHLAARFCPSRVALVADGARITYSALYQRARALADYLHTDYGLQPGHTVGLLCRNHTLSVLLLPALSGLGVHIRLLNTDIPASQMSTLVDETYDLLIYDEEVQTHCLPSALTCRSVSSEALSQGLSTALSVSTHSASHIRLPKVHHPAQISVYTGGSSGQYKEAARGTSVKQFLPPFYALLRDVGLCRHSRVLIALPFYHGFGLASLIVSLLLGKTICLLRRFDAMTVLQLIAQEQIEVLPVVPAMLSRLWQIPGAATQVTSLRCIISGGDRLDPALVRQTIQHVGQILFNLYGTSEAGFMMLANPADLAAASTDATTTTATSPAEDHASYIGRPICGVRCEVRDADAQGIGTLWVRTGWSMIGRQHRWQNTGDLVRRTDSGHYYHYGRADRIAVCGGENVSLDHVETVLASHPSVVHAIAYVAPHPQFGQVVHAKVELQASALSETQPTAPSEVSAETLRLWLSTRLSRAEMPHQLTFGRVEVLSTGKRKSSI